MDTIVRATCPNCRMPLRIPTQWIGLIVRCKGCRAIVRSKARNGVDTPAPANGTAESAPLDQTVPNPKAFDFIQPRAPRDDDPFPLPEPIVPPQPEADPLGNFGAPPVPVPQAMPGDPYPVPPPGYPYAPPPGYPYPVPPGYPAGAYAPPPGYPYPVPPGYPPGAYAPPPGYPYPMPPGALPYEVPQPVVPRTDPVPHTSVFKTDSNAPPLTTGRRYRRSRGKSKLIWVALCFVLTGGLITAGVLGMKHLNDQQGKSDQAGGDGKGEGKPEEPGPAPGPGVPQGAPKAGPFPRRALFISISKYMYLNPLTASKDGVDQSKPSALRLAYDWRIPTEKENNQLFILSDTTGDGTIPLKNVVMGTYEKFFDTSREQDRIVVYFGGHALEKDGKAYLAPVEGELEDSGSLISLDEFYGRLKDCKAFQKVVIWDVCRFNPQRGTQRPGSEPMTPALAKALASAPAGVEVVTSCKPGENALEFFRLQSEATPRAAPRYGGSAFLESMRYVGEKNKAAKSPTPNEPLPVSEWAQAVGKRVAEMAAMPSTPLKQSVQLDGKPRTDSVAYKHGEPVAKRFEMPAPPKGTSIGEIKAIESEFFIPAIRSDLTDTGLSDLPYLESVMKDYKADVPLSEIMRDKEKYRLRAETLAAFDTVREVWAGNAGSGGVGNLKEIEAPITENIKKEINKELEIYAVGIARLELVEIQLSTVAGLKGGETKRWQAHYEYARAVVKARLAYLNEYNKLMGDIRTETLPTLDAKLGQNSYKLVSSEKMKSKKDVQALVDEAQEAYAKLITEHKGTPWALQAKRDRSFSLGLVWQPFVSGTPEAKP